MYINMLQYDPNRDGAYTVDVSLHDDFTDLQEFILRSALARWEHVTNVDYEEGDATLENDLEVGLYYVAYYRGFATSSSSFLISGANGDSLIPDLSNQVHYESLAMHEAGHTLGLGHNFSGYEPTVMDYVFTDRDLSAYDIQATAQLYGPAAGSQAAGTGAADLLVGTGGGDRLSGLAGDDTIMGAEDADRLSGGAGADVLYGNQDQDLLVGGAGDDSLYGGQGSDTLSGGGGDDVLVGGRGADLFVTGAGSDRVADFSATDGDRIAGRLSGVADGGDGAAVTLQTGATVTLVGVQAADVQSGWFVNWLL